MRIARVNLITNTQVTTEAFYTTDRSHVDNSVVPKLLAVMGLSHHNLTHRNVINHFSSLMLSHDNCGSPWHHDSTLKCTLTCCRRFFLARENRSFGSRRRRTNRNFGHHVSTGFLLRRENSTS
mmetsp:Transcript_13532/g.29417  ORF Transcript_13532/g.29417 Transcript_13532/m.29417 type:complete len:123 (+) Transcript_13532:53-421(+)